MLASERLVEHTKRLPPLVVGDLVRIQNQTGRNPLKRDKTGHIIEVRQYDQFVVRVDGSGRVTPRLGKIGLKMLVKVIAVQEDTGPLGGVSYVYAIQVKLSESEEPCKLNYEVGRTFNEFVDMQSKLSKQFSKITVPILSKHLCEQNVSCEERMQALDVLMTKLSCNTDLMNSSVIIDFLQITKNRKLAVQHKSDAVLPAKSCIEKDVKKPQKVEKNDEPLSEDYYKEYEAEPERVTIEIGNSKKKSILGPVAPLRNSNQRDSHKLKRDTVDDDEDVDLFLPSSEAAATPDDTDIFEESKSSKTKLIMPVKTNLFDEFDNEDEDLFKPDEKPKNVIEFGEAKHDIDHKNPPPLSTEETESLQESKKAARVNLFEDLDLGDRVFKDEQHLFYIPDKELEKEKISNVSAEDDEDTNKLLNVDDSLNDIFDILKVEKDKLAASSTQKFSKPTPPTRTKPVPAPRKSSVYSTDQPTSDSTDQPTSQPTDQPTSNSADLPNSQNINRKRKLAREAQHQQAERMVKRSKVVMKAGVVGDNVAVPIPSVDRGRGDPRNIIGVIVEVSDSEQYSIACPAGVLNGKYSRNQFDLCPQKLLTLSDIKTDITVSLRSAVGIESQSGGQGFLNKENSADEKQSNSPNEKSNLPLKPAVAVKPTKPPKPAVKPPVPSKPGAKKPVPPAKPSASSKSVKSEKFSHVDINQYITQQASDDDVNLFG
ncbi:hypothetical protein GQR58_022325 [Nymphon striatum]|nr:hypothetical protein GQR58_022325 [Nymphon striatum]